MIPCIDIQGKTFEQFISKAEIKETVLRLASEINAYYKDKKDILLISILDGSFIFMADIVRELNFSFEIQFVKLRSYNNMESTGEIEYALSIDDNIEGRHILIVEDIIDTGLTIESFHSKLSTRKPASINVCSFLSKPDAHNDIVDINFLGHEIQPLFVVGYGLDLNGYGRNLPDLYKLKV